MIILVPYASVAAWLQHMQFLIGRKDDKIS